MKKEFKVWAMTCIACWLLAPHHLKGQDSLDVKKLEQVVVTASKFPKSSGRTGKVVIVIDSTALSRSGGKDLAQVLGEQAGIYVNGANSNPGKDKALYIRGGATHHSLILIDGVPVTDPSGVNGAIDLRMLPVSAVQRIEVLKGSQSTLYGSSAMAGVVNIITKKGTDRKFFLNALGSYGSYNTVDGRLSAGVRIMPGLYMTVGTGHVSTDGFSEATDTTGMGSFDKDPYRNTTAYMNFRIQPAEGLEIQPYYSFTRLRGQYDAGAFTDDPTAEYNADLRRAGLQATYQRGTNSFSLMAAASGTDRTFSSEFGEFTSQGDFLHTEAVWRHTFSAQLSVTGGLAFQRMALDDPAIPVNHLSSPYASLHYAPGNLGIEAGVRYNHHTSYGNTWTYSLNPYWRKDRWKVFLNVGSGFKAPTLTQLFGPFGPNPGLDPERSVSLEAGAQYVTRPFDIRMVLFDRKISDMIIYTARYENVDEQHVKGVEIEPVWNVNDRYSLSGYYALMVGEVTTVTPEGDSTYNDLIRKPRHAFGLTLQAQPVDKLDITALFRYYGDRDDLYFDMSTFSQEMVRLNAYSLLDVYVEYRLTGTFSAFLNLQNLLDTQYEEVYGYNVRGRTLAAGGKLTF